MTDSNALLLHPVHNVGINLRLAEDGSTVASVVDNAEAFKGCSVTITIPAHMSPAQGVRLVLTQLDYYERVLNKLLTPKRRAVAVRKVKTGSGTVLRLIK